ncbi:hypothetical protein D9611_008630 [Ephemerocybe angulata]|uniref:Uncharacterized protein n=1 Tax=Ephemerocybe angulata TaxID=980116 RepID=A0A8H5AYS4_9AGAR|nr:hypothetical protein D9611_008630 [Tulosesus angulatus]
MMPSVTSYLSFYVACALLANAAPLPQPQSLENPRIQVRDLEVGNGVDVLSLRDLSLGELEDLDQRGLLSTGLKWALNKVPKGHSFKTPTAKYSGQEVNQAAKDALKKAQAGVKENGYPKPGSGFRKSEAHVDPTKGKGVAFHAPLKKKGDTSGAPGPDRVIVHQKPGKTRFDTHVAYHDGKKQIPVGTGSKNHPFSGAKQKTSGGEKDRKGRRRRS